MTLDSIFVFGVIRASVPVPELHEHVYLHCPRFCTLFSNKLWESHSTAVTNIVYISLSISELQEHASPFVVVWKLHCQIIKTLVLYKVVHVSVSIQVVEYMNMHVLYGLQLVSPQKRRCVHTVYYAYFLC